MELAKSPVKFLCNRDAPTFKISVPKTEHPFLFYRNQPYLVKYVLDIEFFRAHDFFDEVDETKKVNILMESGAPEEGESPKEEVAEDATGQDSDSEPEKEKYTKAQLQKMRKSDLREELKLLAPDKSCPVRKNNIINLILEVQ